MANYLYYQSSSIVSLVQHMKFWLFSFIGSVQLAQCFILALYYSMHKSSSYFHYFVWINKYLEQ